MSVTEGEDKPLKYTTIFNSADAALITKIDLASAVEFNAVVANRNIQAVRHEMTVLDVSAKSGEGAEKSLDFLRSRRNAARVEAASPRAKASRRPINRCCRVQGERSTQK
jgi:Ni2+-binding GTPase involved in maturation of urease and hydrogenase